MSHALNLYNAGTRALRTGQLAPAISLLRQAIEQTDSPHIECTAWRNLGIALRRYGATGQAADAFLSALSIDDSDPDIRYCLGNALAALGDHHGAIEAFKEVQIMRPNWAQAVNNEGAAWMALGRATEAETCFSEAIRIDPNFAHAWGNLGAARAAMGLHAAPLHTLKQALALAPESVEIRTKLGHLLTELGHFDASRAAFTEVLHMDPDHQDANAGLAMAMHRSGDTIRALAQIAPAIAAGDRHPNVAVAYARISLLMGQANNAAMVLKEALDLASAPATRILLGTHLAQAQDASHDCTQAFDTLKSANDLRPRTYDAEAHALHIDQIIENSRVHEATSRCMDETPVFIIGMPRSGTSLIEQMLDSHSLIHGAGERGELQLVASAMSQNTMSVDTLDTLASLYLDRIRPLAPKARYITDKMPNNFMYLEEVRRLFPAARIIHCTRNPADAGLSCLFQNFKDTLDWTSSPADIADWYRQYCRLMDHWQSNSPLSKITVPYEELVQNPDTWARKILDFLNLPFESAVLEPHKNTRIVRTASHDQIRRPIHTNSIDRHLAYADQIPELMELQFESPVAAVDRLKVQEQH
ncbi:MAG: sulfotransferase [Myxococcota bacterium]